jgi:hypothetical protein
MMQVRNCHFHLCNVVLILSGSLSVPGQDRLPPNRFGAASVRLTLFIVVRVC